MPTYEIDGPGGKTYSIEGPAGMSRDQVVAAIKKRLPADATTAPAEPSTWETIKDIGRGAAHGLARGVEELPSQLPFTSLRKAVKTATRPIAEQLEQYGPTAQAQKYVNPPETPYGVATEYVAENVPTAPLQPGGPITKAVTTIGTGLGEYGGEKAAEALGLPPGVGRFIGGFLGGGVTGGSAQIAAERKARKLLPTSEENRAASKAAYKEVEKYGLTIEPTEVQNFAAGLRADLERAYMTDRGGKVGFAAADRIEKANGKLPVIMDEYSHLGQVKPSEGPNYASAQIARDSILEWIGNLEHNQVTSGDPAFTAALWQQARDTWRVHSGLEAIETALQSAEWRRLVSGQGHNLNTLRQEIRKIISNDNKARRYTTAEREQMERVVEGTMAQNVLRQFAAFAPHGAVSSLPAIITTAAHGAGAGLAIAVPAWIMHMFRGYLEERNVRLLLDLIREASPLLTPEKRLARARLLPQPGRTGAAAARGVLAPGAGSALSEDQQ